MAAMVLASPRAVEMSVYVVRAFVRLREAAILHKDLAQRLNELEDKTDALVMQHDTFSRNTRASCSFHQPRWKSTGVRSSELPEVYSSSTDLAARSAARSCPGWRKLWGKFSRNSRLPRSGRWEKSTVRAAW